MCELGRFFEAQRFRQDHGYKFRSVNKVTASEPVRLERKTEKPFKALVAHPEQTLLSFSYMGVNCGTKANQDASFRAAGCCKKAPRKLID
jgi:hypothetical protein